MTLLRVYFFARRTSRHDGHGCPLKTAWPTVFCQAYIKRLTVVSSCIATFQWLRALVHLHCCITIGREIINTWCSCRSVKADLPWSRKKFDIKTFIAIRPIETFLNYVIINLLHSLVYMCVYLSAQAHIWMKVYIIYPGPRIVLMTALGFQCRFYK